VATQPGSPEVGKLTPAVSAGEIISAAIEEFGASLAVLTSFQREGVIIIDLLRKIAPEIPIVTLDTGRLPAATYEAIGMIEARYGIRVERVLPDPGEVDAMVVAHGRDLFRDSVPQRMLCCNVRKVRPLARRMVSTSAYFTGIRREQNEERENVPVFGRAGSPVKISPLANWTEADVAQYTREHKLPMHPLYAVGYRSIGCDPCTRAVLAGEDERAGRWWWEDDASKECGLHFSPDGRAERTVDVLLRDLLERTVTA
jgi:phosphoadenosine phosphosulfate reductase